MLLLSSSKQNVDIRFFLVNPLTILISHEIILFSKTETCKRKQKETKRLQFVNKSNERQCCYTNGIATTEIRLSF